MQIASPPGYGALVPLDMARHKGLGIRPGAAAFASALHMVYITAEEFFQTSRHLPLVFGREQGGMLVPVAITGVDPHHNVFVDARGQWDPDVYCPAYVRRYPFYSAAIADAAEPQALVFVDEGGLSRDAPALIDNRGKPTRRWAEMERFIRDVDRAQQHTGRLCQRLDELELLEEFEADLHPKNTPRKRLGGLLRVNEQRLNGLPGDVVKDLMLTGELSRVYAHLMSLENFSVLLDRHARQMGRQGSD